MPCKRVSDRGASPELKEPFLKIIIFGASVSKYLQKEEDREPFVFEQTILHIHATVFFHKRDVFLFGVGWCESVFLSHNVLLDSSQG